MPPSERTLVTAFYRVCAAHANLPDSETLSSLTVFIIFLPLSVTTVVTLSAIFQNWKLVISSAILFAAWRSSIECVENVQDCGGHSLLMIWAVKVI